jgi:quercetin dioxygenase-like cupin family protein
VSGDYESTEVDMSRTEQQAPGIERTDLQQHDLSIPGREVVHNRVDISPQAPAFKHTHPGEEIIYVLEGSLEYRVEGEPPTTLEAGEVFFVPAETIHAVKNVGTANGAELATYVVEKGSRSSSWPSERRVNTKGEHQDPSRDLHGPYRGAPLRIDVPEENLLDLRRRIAATRWPDKRTGPHSCRFAR